MPAYAIIGATGSTGSAILRCLLSEPPRNLQLSILVRSKSKLLKAFPELEETLAFALRIIEGTSTDVNALERCLEDAVVVFMCVGRNESKRGVSLSYDTAAAVVKTLKTLHKLQGSDYATPTIIQLRSASLNPLLSRENPWIVNRIVKFYLRYELQRACNFYTSAAKDSTVGYFDNILVDPPTIYDAGGTERTGFKLISEGEHQPALSHADLGVVMCAIAERRVELCGQAVGVIATGSAMETSGTLLSYLLLGAKNRFVSLLVGAEPARADLNYFYNG